MNKDSHDISGPNIDLSRGYLIGEYKPDAPYSYDHINKCFSIRKRGSIIFTTKDDKNYQSTLWEILLESWEQNQLRPVRILKQEIISRVAKRINENWYRNKLRSNLSHLVKKIGTNKLIAGLVKLETDKTDQDCVLFHISVPID